MNLQIEKMQMLYAIEKSLMAIEIKKQKKSTVLAIFAIVLSALALLTANVAVFLYIADLHYYANSAWLMVMINLVLALIPIMMIISQQSSAPEMTIIEIRDSLADDLNLNMDKTSDIKNSVENLNSLGKDIRTYSKGGFNAFLPIAKLAGAMVKPSKNKTLS